MKLQSYRIVSFSWVAIGQLYFLKQDSFIQTNQALSKIMIISQGGWETPASTLKTEENNYNNWTRLSIGTLDKNCGMQFGCYS